MNSVNTFRPAIDKRYLTNPGADLNGGIRFGDSQSFRCRMPGMNLEQFPTIRPDVSNPFMSVIENLISVIEGIISRLAAALGQQQGQGGVQPAPGGTTPPDGAGTGTGGTGSTGSTGGIGATGGTGGTGSTGSSGGTGGTGETAPPKDDMPADGCDVRTRFPLTTIEGIKSGQARKIAKEKGWKVRIIKQGQKIPPDFRNDRITLVVDKRGKVKDAHYC
ncbi:MAG: hypothetical protein L6Q35_04280 [Phycisphaerales bacterium]|nr:hypothetical protein [Phycisphaerales bacterium]